MLFLLFRLGNDRYALDASQVAEVLPLVTLREVPQAPAGVAGIFNCRGIPVPVIDLSELMLGRPAQRRLSTRIALTRYTDDQGVARMLGVMAEQVTETVRRDPADFVDSGVTNHRAPYLGPVAFDSRGLIQWIDVKKLPSVQDQWSSQISNIC